MKDTVRDLGGSPLTDVVKRLESVAALVPGSELPDWLPVTNWAPVFQALLKEAAMEIRTLRALHPERG